MQSSLCGKLNPRNRCSERFMERVVGHLVCGEAGSARSCLGCVNVASMMNPTPISSKRLLGSRNEDEQLWMQMFFRPSLSLSLLLPLSVSLSFFLSLSLSLSLPTHQTADSKPREESIHANFHAPLLHLFVPIPAEAGTFKSSALVLDGDFTLRVRRTKWPPSSRSVRRP